MAEPESAADLAAWVRLTSIPGIGGESQRHLLKAFGLPAAIFAAGGPALRSVIGAELAERLASHDASAGIETALAWAAEPGNRIVTLADPAYPQALLATADPPALLYAKGRVELLNRPALAIVGSRNATKQGEANAEAFAATLAAAGLAVVSGLALGIDAAAHRGALRAPAARGATIAFIGTGADRIYPAKNEALSREIAEHGCIVSEFPLGTAALPGNFPRRNRLIAGISLGCLVVEAAEKSGSLITARLAADAGREVFAIPGSIHSPLAKGCHQLIRQGAKLVEKAEDILEELRWQPVAGAKAARPAFDAGPESVAAGDSVLLGHLDDAPVSLDALAARSGLTPADLLAMLLSLELEGRVAQLPGGLYQRVSRGRGPN
jgi:DNA processing protein